jgi:hypothetical protein
MIENKQFSAEEIEQIKKLQEKYNVLGIQLVQLKLAQKNTELYLKTLNEQESLIETQIMDTNQEEKKLAEQLDTTYGAGSLDLESGVFTPKNA